MEQYHDIEKGRDSRRANNKRRRRLSRTSRTIWNMEEVFSGGGHSKGSSRAVDEDEEALNLAAIDKLPTYDRLRTSITPSFVETAQIPENIVSDKEVDARKTDEEKVRNTRRANNRTGRTLSRTSRGLSRTIWNMEEVISGGRNSKRSSRAVDEDEEATTYDRLRTNIMQSFVETDQIPENTVSDKEVDVRKIDIEKARNTRRVNNRGSRSLSRTSRSLSRTSWNIEELISGGGHSKRSSRTVDEDEEALDLAAIEKLPTHDRLRKSIMPSFFEAALIPESIASDREVDARKIDVEKVRNTRRANNRIGRTLSRTSRGLSRTIWNMDEVISGGRNSKRSSHAVDEDEEATTYNRLRTNIIMQSFVETDQIPESTVSDKEVDMRKIDIVKVRNTRRVNNRASRSLSRTSRSLSRSLSRTSWNIEELISGGRHAKRSSRTVDEDEEALDLAAIEKLPTYDRLRTSIMPSFVETAQIPENRASNKEFDARKIDVEKVRNTRRADNRTGRTLSRTSRSLSRSLSRTSWSMEEAFSGGGHSRTSSLAVDEDEASLKWAAIEKLPTYDRLRTGIMHSLFETDQIPENKVLHKEVDVRKLDKYDRKKLIDKLFMVADEDNEKYLMKFRQRIDKVGIKLPAVEVRFDNLTIEADCYIGNRALPTLPNAARNIAESILGLVGIQLAKRTKLTILKEASGIIKPSRMTLLLGPISSGKTTLLLALAGKLDRDLKVRGEIRYNGYRLNEFVPQKTSAYISQNDVHVGEMTVKETLDFSARCLGVGTRYDLLSELAKREKFAGIFPDAEIDLFMKATAIKGSENSLITDYILKILGLDICKDTVVGDEMIGGISGGQKRRVTTGEMIVGPTQTLFMDEISTGLDNSTTNQIIKCLQQIAHFTEATILVSLLQPVPETFDLFDDIILLSEGQMVYQGPREYVLDFFESCGFCCPERKGTGDFLQEVTSRKDQEQYWADRRKEYRYISVTEFTNRFKRWHVGMHLKNELSVPFDKSRCHKAALVFEKYTVPRMELLKACWEKEWLLIKRNSSVYVFKTVQLIIFAFITSTVFIRTRMHTRNENDGALFIGASLFSVFFNMFNGFAEMSMMIQRLPVFYKQRDLMFHPAWAFTLPTVLLNIPISVLESVVWIVVTYYTMGFAPEASRFFKNFLLVFLIRQMASGVFRLIAGVCRTMIIANTAGALTLLLFFLLGGFIIPKYKIPSWWEWGYWFSPLTYGYNAITGNEMYAPRWMNKLALDNVTKLGVAVLNNFDIPADRDWYWIGAAALFGFIVLTNVLFTFALMYLNPLGKPQATLSEEGAAEMVVDQEESKEKPRLLRPQSKKDSLPQSLYSCDTNNSREMEIRRMSSRSNPNGLSRNVDSNLEAANGVAPKRGMVLPFTPLAMSFENVNYYVDMPPVMKEYGVSEDKLQLLREVTGTFRPGVLTALMGVSGSGKTTLMDVLAGRKTDGYIEGDIRISGFPKRQETFARISGYCEQNDIHSPQVTVKESLIYSAFLRLPKEVTKEEKMTFVEEVMELVELDSLKDAIVGLPGVTGLSTDQRKRLTIAVELVANPSIVFMDEPTSGLDARAAATVMRIVRNTVDTGRTVVFTIQQPSIDTFESFDELLLMKRGGNVIYSGPLGRNSHKIIEYFEAIPGVPKIKEKYNPATWMLEVSSVAAEDQLSIDFADAYKLSSLYWGNKALVKELSTPSPGAKELYFATRYTQSRWGQFKYCLWKQWWTYWRSHDYNLFRYCFTLVAALLVGTIFWKVGTKREDTTDLTMIIGAMYAAVLFVGINNCSTVQPIVAIERTVFYRERAAGMYSALPYAIAQVISQIPYVIFQSAYYTLIVYAMVSFEWTAAKFWWFLFVTFFSFLYFTYFGMMTVSITRNHQEASIFAAAFYALFNLFSGFFIPRPKIPMWWIWYYWICPVAWTVYGLIASQYGDVEDSIRVSGMIQTTTVKAYIEDHFGYESDFMGPVAAVLVGFTVSFAFMFAFCIKTLNFQMR